MRKAFESFLVGAPRAASTVKPTMLIEKLGEELLGRGLGGGVGGSPYLESKNTPASSASK